jgi:NAD(P)-dependent dehydrogenase (short-subunit alcohol dehydrogenase family)
MELEGKTAVITGGASGIGLATAKRFAASGVNLVLGDIEAEPLARVIKEFEDEGAKAVGVLADVTVESDVVALREAALTNFGGAHVVFNNAGVAAGATINTPTSVWKWVLDVDLNGVIYGLNAFVPLFVEQDEGHVINTASLAGLGGAPFMGPYCAAKYAVVGLSESLFQELLATGSNVHVSVLCPGFVKTRIHESTRNIPNELMSFNESPTQQFMNDMASSAVNAGIDPADVGVAVENAVRTNKFWILPHERSAIRTTELRLEWMRGGAPMTFDLMAATKP